MTPAEQRRMNNAVYAQQLGSPATKKKFATNNGGRTPTQYIKFIKDKYSKK
jgi:hypothetical protein